jgi:hypothetical protein
VNLFGVDVTGLDVDAFLTTARHLYPLLGLSWLVLVWRARRPGLMLVGALLANAYVWLETNWPLQRLYALGPSSDRVNNLALCQVVAVGHSPLHTPQVGQMHFEPFWAVVTAAVSGWDSQRLVAVYAWLPLMTACGLALSLYFAFAPSGPPAPSDGAGDAGDEAAWSGWERALIALFATLLSSAALDYAGPYRVPWAMTFLLKPNHALGLVLFPWVLRGFARIRGWGGRIGVGVLLHLLGWVFVIHMGEVCVGLACFAVMCSLWRRGEARAAWLDVASVIGINLVIVSPYLVMLFRGYGVLDSGPRLEIPPSSPHLLEITTRVAPLFVLAAWGSVVAWRRDRLGRVLAAQTIGAVLVWLSYFPLSLLQQAKERDDTYYWLRVQLAIAAAIGAWDLARRLAPRLGVARWSPAARATALAALALPLTVPYWWDPSRMDLYFAGSVAALPPTVRDPAVFLRGEDPSRTVLAGDPGAARWMAALAGTRVTLARDFAVPKDYSARLQLNDALVRGGPGDPVAEAARWGVSHFVVTPDFLAPYGVGLDELETRPYLRQVYFAGDARGDYVAVYAIRSNAS